MKSAFNNFSTSFFMPRILSSLNYLGFSLTWGHIGLILRACSATEVSMPGISSCALGKTILVTFVKIDDFSSKSIWYTSTDFDGLLGIHGVNNLLVRLCSSGYLTS